jgi:hypothetical protein
MSELLAARSTKGAICTLIFRAKNVAPNAIKRISNKIARYEVQKRRRPLQDGAGALSWAFPNLTDDVVLGILTFCGIPGVLTVSQVSLGFIAFGCVD